MKNKILILSFFTFLFINGYAQKYITKTGYAYFKSHTDAIDIEGSNSKVAAILDTSNGEMVVIILIKAFELPLATADKHFNETYMESEKFPKSTFKGNIMEFSDLNLTEDGEQEAMAHGILNIHGQDRTITQKIKLIIKNGILSGNCKFNVNIDDYNINIPNDVKDRVAKEIEIKVEMTLLPL